MQRTKLTEEKVIEMRQLRKDGAKVKDIAERFGISCSSTSNALTGKTWSHVNGAFKPLYSNRLTEEEVIKMRQLRKDGAKVKDIAERFGISCVCASYALTGKTWSHVNGAFKPNRLTEEEVIKMRQLRKDGAKVKDIAERFGIHCTSTSRVLTGKIWSHVNGAFKPNRLTEEKVIKMRQLRKDGAKVKDIAERFGIARASASQALTGKTWSHVNGAVKPLYSKKKLTEEEVIEIRQLRKDGAKVKDIAERFGIHYMSVSRVLNGRTWSSVGYGKPIKALEIRWLKENKVRTKDIAKLYGMSCNGVYAILRAFR
ncbi:MAG: hypothetical protein GY853_05650 [PVC group bacterium]|nr:hypothetical protein [PVC group bacterium]